MNNPAVQFCIKAVRDGLLGNVFDLDTSMGRYDGASYRSLIKTYKGGIAYILACHLIDLVVTLAQRSIKQSCTRSPAGSVAIMDARHGETEAHWHPAYDYAQSEQFVDSLRGHHRE